MNGNNIVGVNISGAAKVLQDLSVEEKIEFVRGLGVNAVELHPYREWPAEQGGLFGQTGESLKSLGGLFKSLDAVSIHAPMGDTPTVKDQAKRAEAIEGVRDSLRAASFLGAGVAVVHIRAAYMETPEDEQEAARVYRDLGDYAQALGVKVAVETSTDLQSTAQFLRFIETIAHENVGATLDTGHLLRCMSEEEKSSDAAAGIYNDLMLGCANDLLQMGKLWHVHLNDVRRKNFLDHYGMGMGFVDFESVFTLLRKYDYAGMLLLEVHRGDSDEVGSITREEIQAAVDFVKHASGDGVMSAAAE